MDFTEPCEARAQRLALLEERVGRWGPTRASPCTFTFVGIVCWLSVDYNAGSGQGDEFVGIYKRLFVLAIWKI